MQYLNNYLGQLILNLCAFLGMPIKKGNYYGKLLREIHKQKVTSKKT